MVEKILFHLSNNKKKEVFDELVKKLKNLSG